MTIHPHNCQFREARNSVSPEHSRREWLPAQVPGSVHTDLLALDRIPDPFVADNELRVQWVTEHDWEYRLTFAAAPEILAEERAFLVCDGLDTLAGVTFNGKRLGHAENMFRRYRWDVTDFLVEGDNEAHILFPSPTAYIREKQAEQPLAVRIGVEYWRRNRRCTSGTLYWQLNDCWPVASWASLDYFGRWKALHYAARRFYAPVLLSAEEWRPGDAARPAPEGCKPEVSLYVTNDLTGDWRGTVRWSLETLAGKVVEAGEESVTASALDSACVCKLDFSDQVSVANRREVVLVYELWQNDERLSLGVLPFVPNKHLKLDDPELRYNVSETDEGFEIAVTARRLARFVWLALDPPTLFGKGVGADAVFGDNYFDLPAGRTVTVRLPALDGWTAERVRSLVDSF